MLNYSRLLIWAFLAAGAASGQIQFEVASIRPAAPDEARLDIGMHVDGAQVRFNFLTVRDCMRIAYEVKNYQLIGPDWIASDRFNIAAKLPAGAGQGLVHEMLRNLLADRFQMTIHREKRDFPIYALTTGKGGLRLKETAVDAAPVGTDVPKPAMDMKATASSGGVYVDLGDGAYFTFVDNHLVGHKLPMWRIADMLTSFMDKPVVDMSGLDESKSYDFSFGITPEDYRTMQIRGALNGGMNLPPEAARLADLPTESLSAAIEGAGLRIDARKAPLDVIVIDRVERTATAN